jgi:hypothetical protein
VPMFSGLLDDGELYHRYEEDKHEGMRLGRNQWLDAKSLAHMIENDVRAMSAPFEDQDWERVLPILDQGQLGSCTGNAGTGALGTQPFYDAVGKDALGEAANDADAGEKFAVELYSEATHLDPYAGSYPPDDTGSSGLAICKALKARGTISGYRWARSPYGLVRLLQDGPVLQGMPWYNAFFEPDSDGYIDSNRHWRTSGVAGGHEVEAVGIQLDTNDAFNSTVVYCNSWSTTWGQDGRFKMRLRTYEQLNGMDLKQYRI